MKNKYQQLVNNTIPISKSIGWNIQALSSSHIITNNLLAPNINIHNTAFAGSQYACCMATGWTLMKCWADLNEYPAELVAAEGNIRYLKPVTTDFICQASFNEQHQDYKKLLERKSLLKSSSVALEVEIICENIICAIMDIKFVFKI